MRPDGAQGEMSQEGTPERIKRVARRLFAKHGIDGVPVRDIVAAAGARNQGSLHYYFRSKEALVRELVLDGAKIIDERRNAQLDALEAQGGRPTLRDVIEILVWPSTGLNGDGQEDTYIRFITVLQMNHRDLFLEALENRWNSGYLRCLAHIERLLPQVPLPILKQRMVFMGLYMGAVLSAREAALDRAERTSRLWGARATIENFIDTIEALLACAPTHDTQAALAPPSGTDVSGSGEDAGEGEPATGQSAPPWEEGRAETI